MININNTTAKLVVMKNTAYVRVLSKVMKWTIDL